MRGAIGSTVLGTKLYLDDHDPRSAVVAFRKAERGAPAELRPAVQLLLALLDLRHGRGRVAARMLPRARRSADPVVADRARTVLTEWRLFPEQVCDPFTPVERRDLDHALLIAEHLAATRARRPARTRGTWTGPAVPRVVVQGAGFVVAAGLALAGTLLIGWDGGTGTWHRLAGMWPVVLVAVLFAVGSWRFSAHAAKTAGRLHLDRVVPEPAENELFVLYLRSFNADAERGGDARVVTVPFSESFGNQVLFTFFSAHRAEENLVAAVRPLGRVLAIDLPGRAGPPAGSERLQVPTDNWQDPVRALMTRARLVVIALDPTPGTLWEFVEARKVVAPQRLLLVAGDERSYRAFRELAAAELGEQVLPEYRAPDLPVGLPFFSGLVTYSPAWEPTFTPLDQVRPPDLPASRMTRHVEPVLLRLVEHENAEDPGGKVVVVPRPPYRTHTTGALALAALGMAAAVTFLVLTRNIWAWDLADWLVPTMIVLVSTAQLLVQRRRRGDLVPAPPPIQLKA
ncbi:hypothetical protein [Nocardia sp. NRRL S-836]|uniref:hypothetical protein n=1 Tax=Nocardia sp. NRRL S-836 TaxID=1519492 RepID=UPI0006AF6EE8|nr:hypothetical protein [Nocardia sp. NRRL S-836]